MRIQYPRAGAQVCLICKVSQETYRQPSSMELNTAVSFSRLIGLKRCPQASFLKRLSSRKASAPVKQDFCFQDLY